MEGEAARHPLPPSTACNASTLIPPRRCAARQTESPQKQKAKAKARVERQNQTQIRAHSRTQKQYARASSSAGQAKDARAFIVCMCSYACFRVCFDAPFHCFFKGAVPLQRPGRPGNAVIPPPRAPSGTGPPARCAHPDKYTPCRSSSSGPCSRSRPAGQSIRPRRSGPR